MHGEGVGALGRMFSVVVDLGQLEAGARHSE
jgi:hypothetical protein